MLSKSAAKTVPQRPNGRLIKQASGTAPASSKKASLTLASSSTVANLNSLARRNKDDTDSLQSSFNQPLLKEKGLVKLQQSPQVSLAAPRNQGRKVDESLIKSQENPLNNLPRRRFKIDDGREE